MAPARKQKRLNFSQDRDSTTSEVIGTLYLILCPVIRMDSVLGVKGEIIDALRATTDAEIRVADTSPVAEEMVIIIFNYCKTQASRTDSDQVDDDVAKEYVDLQPHCAAQDALLKIHERIAGREYRHGGMVHEKTNGDDAVTARILVASKDIGRLSVATGATICILPGGPHADDIVQDLLVHDAIFGLVRAGGSVPPSHGSPMWSHQLPGAHLTQMSLVDGYESEPSWYGYYTRFEFSIQILCPSERIGRIIGRQGFNIRKMERVTHARIQALKAPPDATECVLHIHSKEVKFFLLGSLECPIPNH